MADNFIANPGSGGDTFAADDIGGVKVPRSKLVIGADGVNDGDVSAANPLPITGSVNVNLAEYLGAPLSDTNPLAVNLEQVNGGSIALGNGAVSVTTIRVVQSSDSVPGTLVDNNAFTDGTTRVYMQGYVFDDVAGTALTENDAAAARIDSKRAIVSTIEDATNRGQRLAISAAGAASVAVDSLPASGTGTLSNVSGTASSTTLLASNSARKGGSVYNDSTAILYVKTGVTASNTSFTVKMQPDDYWEIPFGYTGRIDGIWASATGAARVTEYT